MNSVNGFIKYNYNRFRLSPGRLCYGDSMNGFDFTSSDEYKKLDYGGVKRIRKMFDMIKSRNNQTNDGDLYHEFDEDPVIVNIPYGDLRNGYPKTPSINITIGPENDESLNEDEVDDMAEKHFREMLNIPSGVKIFKIKNPNLRDSYNQQFKHIPHNSKGKQKSENFEVIQNQDFVFDKVGGYQNVKDELMQTVDILKHYEKYSEFNVRTPKGLLLEGPPGNGKTLLAKAFSGEVNSSFIPVSGSQFTEKYVGVGASRIREIFKLANENIPCIIFVDEIDALGRSRSSGEETNTNTEAQSTLNELLVQMDGYSSSDGIFIIAATNRGDLLDNALLRPGRIDKRVYIGNPDAKTREEIINIHINGKPYESNIELYDIVEMTNGLSGAQIENLLNEGMLLALRSDRNRISRSDLDTILSRMLVGYQSSENNYSDDMIRRIAIHELGHAIVGILSLHHANLVKICLNAWSPTSPGYTIFETAETDSSIYTKEKLNSRLMVLLSGRIAEEIFFGASITSGASKDIEDAYSLAEQMIVKFGMGRKIVYPHHSEISKNNIDKDIERLIETAYQSAKEIVISKKHLIDECANELIKYKILMPKTIYNKLN
jgi:cell division protease FtsH